MKNQNMNLDVVRMMIGTIIMTLVVAVVYTLLSYGTDLFFPYFFIVGGVTAALTIGLFLPLAIVLIKTGWNSIFAVVAAAFSATFLLFFILNCASMGASISHIAGGEVLVANGEITSSGYLVAFRDACVTALVAAVGGAFFWLVSFRGARGKTAT